RRARSARQGRALVNHVLFSLPCLRRAATLATRVRLTRKDRPVSTPAATPLPDGAKAKLSVVKGLRVGTNYGIKEGVTYVGRKGPHAVAVGLSEQENPGVAVAVNRFALIWFDAKGLGIADTGRQVTVHNGVRLPSGKRFPLQAEDTLQFGRTVLQVKVIVKKRTGVQK